MVIIQYHMKMVDIDPFKNFTPRGNPTVVQPTTDTAALTEAQCAELLSDHDKLRNLAKSKLIEIIHGSKATTALVPALKELLDRIDGKPAQSIAMVVENKGLDQLATDKLLRLAAMLDEPVVIAPMPKKLDMVDG